MNSILRCIVAPALLMVAGSVCQAQLSVTNGLTFWVKGDAGIVTNASGKVTAWNDQSGNNANLLQSIDGLRPIVINDAWNGKSFVRFDGSVNHTNDLTGTANSTIISNIITAAEFTVVSVWRFRNVTDNGEVGVQNHDRIFGSSTDTASGIFGLILRTNGIGGYTASQYNRDSDVDIATVDGVLHNEPQLFSSWHTNSEIFLQQYGGSPVSAASGNTGFMTGALRLGDGPQSSRGPSAFDGDIAEVLIYRRALSTDERSQVESYLYQRWVIPEPSSAVFGGVAALMLWYIRRR